MGHHSLPLNFERCWMLAALYALTNETAREPSALGIAQHHDERRQADQTKHGFNHGVIGCIAVCPLVLRSDTAFTSVLSVLPPRSSHATGSLFLFLVTVFRHASLRHCRSEGDQRPLQASPTDCRVE